jgi:hypothetical protein
VDELSLRVERVERAAGDLPQVFTSRRLPLRMW